MNPPLAAIEQLCYKNMFASNDYHLAIQERRC